MSCSWKFSVPFPWYLSYIRPAFHHNNQSSSMSLFSVSTINRSIKTRVLATLVHYIVKVIPVILSKYLNIEQHGRVVPVILSDILVFISTKSFGICMYRLNQKSVMTTTVRQELLYTWTEDWTIFFLILCCQIQPKMVLLSFEDFQKI